MVATTLDRLNGINGGIAIKAPCRAATTANITLSGEQTIDGIAVVADDRVLVKSQTNGVENGIYDVSTGSWSRSLDFDGNRDIVTGTVVLVTAGTVNAGTLWRVSTTGAITIDTTSIALTSGLVGGSATSLATPRTIGGVSFDGTANIVPQTIQTINEAGDTTCFPLFVSASGSQSLQPLNNTALTFNASTANFGCTTFTGALVGNASTATSATSAATLTTPRTIGGVSFDGSGAIVPQTIQSINDAADSTCFPLFITASGSQSLQPKNNASFTFDATTAILGANGFLATGTTIPTNGVYSSAANNLDLSARSLRVLNLSSAVSAVNYFVMSATATGVAPSFGVGGTDPDIAFSLTSKGTGNFALNTASSAHAGLLIVDAASAVNYFTITEAATTASPTIAATGSDTNLNFVTVAKGTGVLVNTGSNTNTTGTAANLNIDASGLIKKSTSSSRYKNNIEDMYEEDFIKILRLRPVWHRSICSGDNKNWSYNSLIAEDVAELNPRWALWDYLPIDRVYDEKGHMTIREDAKMVPDGISWPSIIVGLVGLVRQQERRILELENIGKIS